MKSVNKKGSVIHWIIFGVLAGFGVFFIFTSDIGVKGLEGDWQTVFLDTYYLEAEKDLLKAEQTAKFAAWEVILELSEEGGEEDEECGSLEGYTLWNKVRNWCVNFGEIEVSFNEKVKEKLKVYSEIKIDGSELVGKGEKKTQFPKMFLSNIPYMKYTYDTNFRVDLGYNFDEYNSLLAEAQDFVPRCKKEVDLQKCVEEGRGVDWRLKDCGVEEYNETSRKVLFCVESAVKVYNSKRELVPVRYKFALDFNN